MSVEMRERGFGRKKRKKREGEKKSVHAQFPHKVNAVDFPRKKCHISFL